MKKQEAMQRLQAMQAEMDQLKAIIEKPDTPEVFQGRYLRKGLGKEHWWLLHSGTATRTAEPACSMTAHGDCFATEEAVNKHAEHLRLMQEARIAMAEDWGDEKVDWSDRNQCKFAIYIHTGEARKDSYYMVYNQIHFRTEAARDKFFDSYTQEQLKLMIMGVQ